MGSQGIGGRFIERRMIASSLNPVTGSCRDDRFSCRVGFLAGNLASAPQLEHRSQPPASVRIAPPQRSATTPLPSNRTKPLRSPGPFHWQPSSESLLPVRRGRAYRARRSSTPLAFPVGWRAPSPGAAPRAGRWSATRFFRLPAYSFRQNRQTSPRCNHRPPGLRHRSSFQSRQVFPEGSDRVSPTPSPSGEPRTCPGPSLRLQSQEAMPCPGPELCVGFEQPQGVVLGVRVIVASVLGDDQQLGQGTGCFVGKRPFRLRLESCSRVRPTQGAGSDVPLTGCAAPFDEDNGSPGKVSRGGRAWPIDRCSYRPGLRVGVTILITQSTPKATVFVGGGLVSAVGSRGPILWREVGLLRSQTPMLGLPTPGPINILVQTSINPHCLVPLTSGRQYQQKTVVLMDNDLNGSRTDRAGRQHELPSFEPAWLNDHRSDACTYDGFEYF